MASKKNIDIKENDLLKIDADLLEILLKDMTTGKNIIWATDNYSKYGSEYSSEKEIKIELITSNNGEIIKPRVEKSKEEQQLRVRQKAEVFTPSWVCNMQNNLIDESWFGRKDVFNVEKEKSWATTKEKIAFSEEKGKTWQDYVFSNRLEITCGEAPYLASRYDAVTGDFIEVQNRIGLLDRKLRVVSENIESKKDWLKWSRTALQSVYGFDWQGDNVLLARENLLFTMAEHYQRKFDEQLLPQDLVDFAKIITWNLLQMDGLKFVVPNSCETKNIVEEGLFENSVVSKECEGCQKGDRFKHNGIYCKIMDWKENKVVRFVDLLKGRAVK